MAEADPPRAGAAVRDTVFGLARSVLKDAFGALDGHGDTVEAGGGTYRRAEVTPGRAMTVFGPAGFPRSRYRPSGTGASLVPAEAIPGLTACGMTPAAAGLSMYPMGGLTARGSGDAWRRLCGSGPSTASPVRLSGEAGNRMEECSGEIPPDLREREDMPEGGGLAAGLARRGHDAHERRGSGRKASARRLARGVVRGRGPGRRRGKHAGEPMLRAPSRDRQGEPEVAAEDGAPRWLERNPDLKLAVVADAAPDNRPFLESPVPDVIPVDFWHAARHVKVAADAAFGPDTAEGTARSGRWRHVPRHGPRGVGRVIDALRHLPRKGKGTDDIRRELAFFRSNRRRMECADAADAGYAIGSGSVESANKVLVTARMKRSGQGRGRDGGQGVLTFRSLPGPDASTGPGPRWRPA